MKVHSSFRTVVRGFQSRKGGEEGGTQEADIRRKILEDIRTRIRGVAIKSSDQSETDSLFFEPMGDYQYF